MRISNQIGLAMGLLCLSIGAVASLLIAGIEQVREQYASRTDQLVRSGALSGSIALETTRCRHLEKVAFLAAADPDGFAMAVHRWRTAYRRMVADIESFQLLSPADVTQTERLASWEIATERYGVGVGRIEALVESGELTEPAQAEAAFAAFEAPIAALAKQAATDARELNFAAVESGRSVWSELQDRRVTGTILTLSVLLLAIAWCLYYPGALARPIEYLQRATNRVALGEPDVRCQTRRTDEIGMLAASFDAMSQTIDDRTLTLETALDKARGAVAAKNRFLANMSHELRTPMNGVIGMVDELAESNLDSGQRRCIDTVRDCSEGLLAIVNDILDLSKLEADKLVLVERTFSLVDLGRSVQHLFAGATRDKPDMQVNLCLDDRLPRAVIGDPLRLRQVLSNLVGNAVKFTERGVVELHIVRLDHEAIGFSIRDTGIGIAADQHERIFLPFEQADDSSTRQFGGTGLGLAICRRLVDRMGGKLQVDSEVGTGSTFRFEITLRDAAADATTEPVATEASTPAQRTDDERVARQLGQPLGILAGSDQTPEASDRATDPAPVESESVDSESVESESVESRPAKSEPTERPLAGVRVLIAEDNRVNQMVAKRILESAGCTVGVADDGAIACEMLASATDEPWQVVLMDCQMPVLDGFDATLAIRSQPEFQQVPIIAVTANAMIGDREKCLEAGMDDFVAKPVKRKLLVETIERQMARVAAEASPATRE